MSLDANTNFSNTIEALNSEAQRYNTSAHMPYIVKPTLIDQYQDSWAGSTQDSSNQSYKKRARICRTSAADYSPHPRV